MKRTRMRASISQNNSTVRLRARSDLLRYSMIRSGTLLGLLLLLVLLGSLAWHRGWPQRQAANLANIALNITQLLNFSVRDIVVVGRDQVSRDAILATLGVSVGSPIFSFDASLVQTRLQKLPWVSNVIVERRFPDTVFIRLHERVPMARWQNGGSIKVIDTEGHEITEAKLSFFSHLPLVVGSDAATTAHALFELLKDFPELTKHLRAATRVGERRWDLYLQPSVIVKLPEEDMETALKRLSLLITEQKILDRDVVSIDLRIPDRITFESGHMTPHRTQEDLRL